MDGSVRKKSNIKRLLTKAQTKRLSIVDWKKSGSNKNKVKRTLEDEIELYSRNSFFCLRKRGKFRLFFIKLIENEWFKNFIIITILLSCTLMFLYTYSKSICEPILDEIKKRECLVLYDSDINRDKILDSIAITFTSIFMLEMICKILAKGLILHKGSYLRNGWNIFDFVTTLISFLQIFNENLDNTAGLRVIRLLRQFSRTEKFLGVKRLTLSIILSMPTLINVILFLGFIFVVFATLSIQLFSGVYYYRCRLPPVQVERNNRTMYFSPPVFDRPCSIEGKGMFFCPEEYHCVDFFQLPTYFNLTEYNVTIEDFDIEDEGLKTNKYFFYGLPHFDDIVTCLFNVFCIITYQNWSELANILFDCSGRTVTDIFFAGLVSFGGFFIMKLILAAQNEALIKVRTEELESKIKENEIKKNSLNVRQSCQVGDSQEQNQEINSKKAEGEGLLGFIHSLQGNNLIGKRDGKKSNKISKRSHKENNSAEQSKDKDKDKDCRSETSSVINLMSHGEQINNYLTSSTDNRKDNESIQDEFIYPSHSQNKTRRSLNTKSSQSNTKKNSVFSNIDPEKTKNSGETHSNTAQDEPTTENSTLVKQTTFPQIPINAAKNNKGKDNESVFLNQQRKIIVIENLEIEHACKKLNEKLRDLKSKDAFIDPYLQDIFCGSDLESQPENPQKDNFFKLPINDSNEEKKTFNLFKKSETIKTFISDKMGDIKNMAINRIKFLILEEHSNTPHYIIFNLFVYSVTFVNLIYLAKTSYPMTQETSDQIIFANIFCSSVFVTEIIFKLIVLRFKGFFQDKINVMDFCVVSLGILEIIAFRISADSSDDSNSSLSSFRALRFIRLLKLFKKGFVQRFVNFVITSLRDLVNYCFLLFFFINAFSIIGRELFANKIHLLSRTDDYGYIYPNDISPRENFDSIFNSFITVFILFIGDDWPNIFYEYARLYQTTSYLFFICIIIFGNIMLYNLFLSIMITNYDTQYAVELINLEETPDNGLNKKLKEIEDRVKGYYIKLRAFYEKILNCCGGDHDEDDEEEKNQHGNENNKSSQSKMEDQSGFSKSHSELDSPEMNRSSTVSNLELKMQMKDEIPLIRISLFLFPKTSKLRKFCHRLITRNKIFEYYLYINIMISLIILAIDTPLLTDNKMKKILFIFDIITCLAFTVETVLKIISYGFLLNGKYSYLRNSFNIIDLASLCLSILYILVNSVSAFSDDESVTSKASTAQKVFRVVKIMRILRVFKLIQRSKSLQATLSAFFVSLKQMLGIVLIGSLFIFMFSIVGVTYFRGLFFRCNFLRVPKQFMYQVETKWDCLDLGGEWVNPYPNFDNISASFIMMVEMMTTESWTQYMFASMDSTNVNYQPVKNNRGAWAVFFILYMIFAYFFLLNLAIPILSENFRKEKAQIENSDFTVPIQKELFLVYKDLYKVNLPRNMAKADKLSKILMNILDSIYFDVIVTMCIIANIVTLMMNWPGKSELTLGYIDMMSMLFNYIFILEAAFKIYVFRMEYFSTGWNILDFILVFDSIVNLVLKQVMTFIGSFFDISILRAIRVMRVLRILKKAKSINRIFNLFLNSIPGVINVAILYLITVFIYSVVGMSLFSFVKHQDIISEKWNFQNIQNSVIILIRVTSGEKWNKIMHECLIERNRYQFCKFYEEMTDDELISKKNFVKIIYLTGGNVGCGSLFAIPYFLSFVVVSNMMFLQFFAIIIAATVSDTYVINVERLTQMQILKFKRKWARYDKECTGFMPIESFPRFLFEIGHPLGVTSMKISDYVKVISLLDIYTYEDKKFIFFYDVLTELTKYYMIHKQVIEEYGEGKLFKNLEQTAEEKSELFIILNNDLSDVKHNLKLIQINPYNIKEKYKSYKKDRLISKIKFSESENLKLYYASAIKKISRLTRLYSYMKPKVLKILKKEMYIDDLVIYSANYEENIEQFNLNQETRRSINQTIEEVEEDNSNSFISSSQSENSESCNESRNSNSSRNSDSSSSSNNSSKSLSENKKLNKSQNSDSSINHSKTSKKSETENENQKRSLNKIEKNQIIEKINSNDENKNFLIKSSIFNHTIHGNNSINLASSAALNYTFHRHDQHHLSISPHPHNNQISFNFKSSISRDNHIQNFDNQNLPILKSLQITPNPINSFKENQSEEIDFKKTSLQEGSNKSKSSSKLINLKGNPLNFSLFRK